MPIRTRLHHRLPDGLQGAETSSIVADLSDFVMPGEDLPEVPSCLICCLALFECCIVDGTCSWKSVSAEKLCDEMGV